MKKNTKFHSFTLFGLFALLLMACGAQQSSDSAGGEMDMATEDSWDIAPEEDIAGELNPGELNLGEKIIESASVRYEAMKFDETIAYVEDEIEAHDGQIQDSSRWQSSSSYGYLGERMAMTVRIPKDQLRPFIEVLDAYDDLVVRSQDFNRTDVTQQYRDNDTRIEILKEEEAALRDMLQEQGTLEEILQIRTRLTELVTERELFEKQNQSIDEQVTYSTLTLEIDEIDRANTRETRGFWDRITNALIDSFYRFVTVLQNLFITFIYLIPYLLILGGVGAIAFYIIRNRRKKQNNKL